MFSVVVTRLCFMGEYPPQNKTKQNKTWIAALRNYLYSPQFATKRRKMYIVVVYYFFF